MVPFIDLKRVEKEFNKLWIEKVQEISQKCSFIGGDEVELLEKNLKNHSNANNVVTCANGTDAIQIALRAVGVQLGDKVIVPDMTFWATYEAVINVGAEPVLIDCSLDDQSIDLNILEEALKYKNIKAVILVHLYGWGSKNINEIRSLCNKFNVFIIEDGAQAFGVKFQEKSIFSTAEIATTSFYPSKVLGGAGDGGAIYCKDENIAKKARQLSNHGRSSNYGHDCVGWNSRLDSLQAAYLNVTMNYIDERINSRRISSEIYRNKLNKFSERIKVISPPDSIYENGYLNLCIIKDERFKKIVEEKLRRNKIGFSNVYPIPISQQKGVEVQKNFLNDSAKYLSEHVINLPLFPYMRKEEIEEVISTIEEAIN